MYRLNKDVDRNVQEQEAIREPVSPAHELELDIQVLEERIAPAPIDLNRSETMSGEQSTPEDVKLDILVLEERIAPSRVIGYWSTSGDADDRPTEEVAFYY